MANPIFDQRGQTVQYQYNAAGDINFGSAQSRQQIVEELGRLLHELDEATEKKAMDEELAIDVKANVQKAIVEAKKPEPEGNKILKHLSAASGIILRVAATSTALTGLGKGLGEAAAAVARFFT